MHKISKQAEDRKISNSRRKVLKSLTAVSTLLPAACSYKIPVTQPDNLASEEIKTARTLKEDGRHKFLVRDFSDISLELMRLLKEVAEIEHSLMLQYLYGSFSLKPEYAGLVGTYIPSSDHLLGIAIQEMQHLGTVNRLLVAVGGVPCLSRQDFPFEPDIYPCPMQLEPLSRASLAKYTYAEAPANAVNLSKAKNAEDLRFLDLMYKELGTAYDGNHVGSVYQVVLKLLDEFGRDHPTVLPNMDSWLAKLHQIMAQGEVDHYNFFRAAFMGTHPALASQKNPWDMPPTAKAYPSYSLPVDPSGYVGHPHQYQDKTIQTLAWLSNLHYWAILVLLDAYYRNGEEDLRGLVVTEMLAGLMPLGKGLAKRGAGVPFDSLSVGYAPAANWKNNLNFARSILMEADEIATGVQDHLPSDYRLGVERELVSSIDRIVENRKRLAT